MKLLLGVVIFLGSLSCHSQSKRMCVSIDDLPAIHYGLDNRSEITDGILSALQEFNVPAIGYVNEGKLYSNGILEEERVTQLEKWFKAGMELGNHTYSHMNYHAANLTTFGSDILKGEKVIKGLANNYNQEVRYFRHPYLRCGANKATSDSLKYWLSTHNYEEAPVTIDNTEYLFAKAYAVALRNRDDELAEKVGRAYLEYMTVQLEYYEKASNELLGRNMDHTLLIHANYLNAVYLGDLLEIFKEKGYTFISQSDVLKDPAYELEVTRFDDWGISWIHRWGLSKGLTGDFFKGEAIVPKFVIDLTN